MNDLFTQLQSKVTELMKDEKFSSTAKTAGLGALAGMIFGNNKTRKAGSYAALAGAALYAFNKWQQGKQIQAGAVQADDNEQLQAIEEAHQHLDKNRVTLLTQAMVFAARADGQIDEKEHQQILAGLEALGYQDNKEAIINQWLHAPIDPQLIADQVNDEKTAAEVYLASLSVIDSDHFLEKAYLEQLAIALKLPAELKANLENTISS